MSSYPTSLSIHIHPPAVEPTDTSGQLASRTTAFSTLDRYEAVPDRSANTGDAKALADARSASIGRLAKHFAFIDIEELAKGFAMSPNAQEPKAWLRTTAWLIAFGRAAKIDKSHCIEKMYLVVAEIQNIPQSGENAVLQHSAKAYLELSDAERAGPHLSGLALSRIIEIERRAQTPVSVTSPQGMGLHKRVRDEAFAGAAKRHKAALIAQQPAVLPTAAMLTEDNPGVRKLSGAFTNQKSSHHLPAIQASLTAVHPNRVMPVTNLVLNFFNALHWDKSQRIALHGLEHVVAAMDLVPPHLERAVLLDSAARYNSVLRSREDGKQMYDVILDVIALHRRRQLSPTSPRHTTVNLSSAAASAGKPPPLTLEPGNLFDLSKNT